MSKFVLPDTRHNIDYSKIVYLDKGEFANSSEDIYSTPKPLDAKEDFKLYFKCLGVRAEDKDKFLGQN